MNITMLIIGIGIGTFVASMMGLLLLGAVARDSMAAKKKTTQQYDDLNAYWKLNNEYQRRQAQALERISDNIKSFISPFSK